MADKEPCMGSDYPESQEWETSAEVQGHRSYSCSVIVRTETRGVRVWGCMGLGQRERFTSVGGAALIAESTRTAPETMGTVVAGALDPETAEWLCGR